MTFNYRAILTVRTTRRDKIRTKRKKEIKLTFTQKKERQGKRISRSRGTEERGEGFQSQREKTQRGEKKEEQWWD